MASKPYSEGIMKLLAHKAENTVAIIRINSLTDRDTIDGLVSDIVSVFDDAEQYSYSPPPRQKTTIIRGESMQSEEGNEPPKIKNPKKTYIVVDDYMTSGWNLLNVVSVLEEQGVRLDNIWCLTYINNEKHLDLARNYLAKT